MHKNYEVTSVGKMNELQQSSFVLPDSGTTIPGKMFINDAIKLTGCEISFNAFLPGQFIPFNHKHIKYEEIYIFLSGEGECEIDGEIVKVGEGSVINIQPDAVRNVCNTSKNTILNFIVIQTVKDSMNSSVLTQDGIGVSTREHW